MIRHTPELPPAVQRHVSAQLRAHDWERLLSDMRSLCEGCPAGGDPDICISCPLEGIALDAATLTLKARVAKIQHKGVDKSNDHNI